MDKALDFCQYVRQCGVAHKASNLLLLHCQIKGLDAECDNFIKAEKTFDSNYGEEREEIEAEYSSCLHDINRAINEIEGMGQPITTRNDRKRKRELGVGQSINPLVFFTKSLSAPHVAKRIMGHLDNAEIE